MRVVLDNCIPSGLKRYLEPHFDLVKECRDMGWAELENGKLLTAAQTEFDVFITVDSGIPFQQNLPKYDIGLVVIKARRNNIQLLIPLIEEIVDAARRVELGQAIWVK